jgi:phosphate/sulfate permease
MASAIGDLTSIGGGLVWNILKGIGTVVFAVGLYYLVKFIQKSSKKQKAFTINAVIEDMNGVIEFDKLALIKTDSGLLEMIFQNRKTDSIPPIPKHLIRNNNVVLLNYAPGHYAVVDVLETQNNYRKGIKKIVLFNLGMKKYIVSKQREIMNKAEDKKKKWEQYAPWITMAIAIIAGCLLAWALFFFGARIQSANLASRIAECMQGGRF